MQFSGREANHIRIVSKCYRVCLKFPVRYRVSFSEYRTSFMSLLVLVPLCVKCEKMGYSEVTLIVV